MNAPKNLPINVDEDPKQRLSRIVNMIDSFKRLIQSNLALPDDKTSRSTSCFKFVGLPSNMADISKDVQSKFEYMVQAKLQLADIQK